MLPSHAKPFLQQLHPIVVVGWTLTTIQSIQTTTGPFNSWNRQVYWWDGPDGKPTHWKQNDTISYNFILANYHSSMAM